MDSQKVLAFNDLYSKSDVDYRVKKFKLEPSPELSLHFKQDLEKVKSHTEINGKPSIDFDVQSSLKQEIRQLEKRLKDQVMERQALENAVGYQSSSLNSLNNGSATKPAKELIKEIATLEVQVMHLEQYLLSLYRKAFDQQSIREKPKRQLRPLESISCRMELPQRLLNETSTSMCREKLDSSSVYRSHSALSYRSAKKPATLARALDSFHSQSLCFLEDDQSATQRETSLAEYLGSAIVDHVPETPNIISENMVRCMSVIYCKLSDPPLVCHGYQSPTSSFSSASALSPQHSGDVWSPRYRKESILDFRLINPFRVEGLKEFSGPYNSMVEIPYICRDNCRLRDVQDLLQNYQSLVDRLESVNLRRMKTEEKLAFWINVHNAMMMHAYLVHGFPHKNIKKQTLLAKITYLIGGHSVSADRIRGPILRCNSKCPREWLKLLLSPRMKFKVRDEYQGYALEHTEPLLYFALSSGTHSDPAVRIYTPKKLVAQLQVAKSEYIRATVGIKDKHTITLPKMLDTYAKESGLNSQALIDMIRQYLPETLRRAMRQCRTGRAHKIIEWVPHNFAFRYLLSRELTQPAV
ncbi:uncharacterized protein LOC120276733 [Dioscorea cayenensis subsp. rotundata]|uniref:Uncharacterized protein LOC120276733 n=1 Tax=Dioscorea cayennensis subsp. rotundata TaxID=55577 RepID=A0AB40CH69_DIOCR|nr:uncharacterized protein LOC120276733 [Dioscorea cayenensis subsp. rotundata]